MVDEASLATSFNEASTPTSDSGSDDTDFGDQSFESAREAVSSPAEDDDDDDAGRSRTRRDTDDSDDAGGGTTTTQADLPDPTASDSPAGEVVTGGEATRLVEEARETERTIRNLGERKAVSAQLEQQFGVEDPRGIAAEEGVQSVGLNPSEGSFEVTRSRTQRASEQAGVNQQRSLTPGTRQQQLLASLAPSGMSFARTEAQGIQPAAEDVPRLSPSTQAFARREVQGIQPTATQQLVEGTQPDGEVPSQVSNIVTTEARGAQRVEAVTEEEARNLEFEDSQPEQGGQPTPGPAIDAEGGVFTAEQEARFARQTGADFAFDLAFGGEFAEQYNPSGGDEIDISGPHIELSRFELRRTPAGGVVVPTSQPIRPGEPGELDTGITDRLTRGRGLLTEQQESQVQEDIQQRQEFFGVGEEAGQFVEDITGSERAGQFARGLGEFPGQAAGATGGLALGADLATEAASNAPQTIEEEGLQETISATAEVGGRVIQQQASFAEENPERFSGQITAGLAGGAIAGKALGAGTRFTRDRVRTAGAETFDLDEGAVVNRQTGRLYDPTDDAADVDAGEARFPGATDTDLYESDPPTAVRQQADEFTPESVQERFAERGVTEGAVLKKALDVEPEGPGARRVGGLRTQEGSFESPGGFVGPELSPNFLRIGQTRSSFSLRPGLPDFGDRATGVLVRTDVEAPDADDLDSFSRELLEREGETTARTKPASQVAPGEIEAVIPPKSEFADIGGGFARNALRRVGIGSDFAVRIGGRDIPGTDVTLGGRRVPLRPVADPDAIEGGATRRFRDFLSSERGQLGADIATGQQTRSLSEIREPIRPATDRPIPLFPSGPPTNETAESVAPVSDIDPTEAVPSADELGVESDADRRRARSSPQLEDTAAEDLMGPPTGSSSRPVASSRGQSSFALVDDSIASPSAGDGRSEPVGSVGGFFESPTSGGSGVPSDSDGFPVPPSAPGSPASSGGGSSPPSSPGSPGSPGSPPFTPPSSGVPGGPPTKPPTRPVMDLPDLEGDSDRKKRDRPLFEEQFFRAVGTPESIVFGEGSPGADEFSPPEAEFNTEPEPEGTLPVIDNVEDQSLF